MPRFTIADVGCYADGAFGHHHIRARLADLLEECARHCDRDSAAPMRETAAQLRADMTDDAAEEEQALLYLNDECDGAVCFEMQEGDLRLLPVEDDA